MSPQAPVVARPPDARTPEIGPRAQVVDSICEATGHTPLVRLEGLDASLPGVQIWGKLEFANPGGSVKDRPALNLLRSARADGRLRPGMSIIDSTSGNTGIALALYGAALGHPVTLVMPENVSTARKNLLRAYGAQIVFSDPMEGSDGAIRRVREIVNASPDRYFYTNQYNNPANWQAHLHSTGPEILGALGPSLTHVVAGVGTSGTIMGTGRAVKASRPDVQIVGVEPDDAFHGLEGLKHLESSIVPGIYDGRVLDRTIFLPTEEGWDVTERLATEEGLLVGHSGGAVVAAALRIGREQVEAGAPAVIVGVLPDHAARYVEPTSR